MPRQTPPIKVELNVDLTSVTTSSVMDEQQASVLWLFVEGDWNEQKGPLLTVRAMRFP